MTYTSEQALKERIAHLENENANLIDRLEKITMRYKDAVDDIDQIRKLIKGIRKRINGNLAKDIMAGELV